MSNTISTRYTRTETFFSQNKKKNCFIHVRDGFFVIQFRNNYLLNIPQLHPPVSFESLFFCSRRKIASIQYIHVVVSKRFFIYIFCFYLFQPMNNTTMKSKLVRRTRFQRLAVFIYIFQLKTTYFTPRIRIGKVVFHNRTA